MSREPKPDIELTPAQVVALAESLPQEDCTAQHVSREYAEAHEAMRKVLKDLMFFCENVNPHEGWLEPWDAARNALKLSDKVKP